MTACLSVSSSADLDPLLTLFYWPPPPFSYTCRQPLGWRCCFSLSSIAPETSDLQLSAANETRRHLLLVNGDARVDARLRGYTDRDSPGISRLNSIVMFAATKRVEGDGVLGGWR